MKRRILYLTYHPEIGGGETILLYLLSKLNRKLFEPVVVVPQKGQLSRKLEELKIPTYFLPLSGYLVRTLFIPGMSPLGVYQFLKLTQKIKPDLIHLNHLNLAVYSGSAGKLLGIPVVATAHGPWDAYYFFQDIINHFFTDRILANTPLVAKQLLKRKILEPKKVEIVYFGVDTNRFGPGNQTQSRRRFSLSQKDIVITIVGRLDPVKDHLTFLRAADIVLRKFLKVTFFIVGSSLGDFSGTKKVKENQETLIATYLARHKGLAKRVIFGGFVESIENVYRATDILVSSSLSESFPLVLMEAAACGVPIVSTNVGGQHLIVKHNQTGFLVPPQKPDLLAEKILQLAKSPSLRNEFGKSGRLYVGKKFKLTDYAKRVENVYLQLIHKRNG